MQRHNIPGNSPWEPVVGYSRAVRGGPQVWVAGTTGTDASGDAGTAGDAAGQARQALENIRAALGRAGARLEHVVRTRIYVTALRDVPAVGRVHAEYFGGTRPAATLVQVSRLVEPWMLVEIEADAVVTD